jgi:type IV secretory pathway VirB9-like protein
MASSSWLVLAFILLVRYPKAEGFVVVTSPKSRYALQLSNGFEDGMRKQEIYLEAASLSGADQIAQMEVSERAKRALLAEA